MKEKDYLFAVSSIRANEAELLNESDMEQLINAPDYKKAIAILAEKGYEEPQGSNYSQMLDREIEKTWNTINKSAPEAIALRAFIVKNDFQNLKAILKAEVTGNDASKYFVLPALIDPDDMLEKVKQRQFSDLPDFISECAVKAYDTLIKTGNGQLCDIIIDTKALEAIIAFAKESNDNTLIDYAENFCFSAAIKTAYRSIKTNKNETFLNLAIAECDLYDKKELIIAALKGEDEFFDFLQTKGFSAYKDALKQGTSTFEKFCDDKSMEIMKTAKMTVFGISPLAGYFVAKEMESKCLRIILAAKISGVDNEAVRERMRALYV